MEGCPSPDEETTRYCDQVPDVIDLLARVTASMDGGEIRPGQLEMARVIEAAVADVVIGRTRSAIIWTN